MEVFPKCVGCGYCCLSGICVVGYMRMKRAGPVKRCEFLKWNGERYLCQLVVEDSRMEIPLFIGSGCPSNLNTWRKDVKFRG